MNIMKGTELYEAAAVTQWSRGDFCMWEKEQSQNRAISDVCSALSYLINIRKKPIMRNNLFLRSLEMAEFIFALNHIEQRVSLNERSADKKGTFLYHGISWNLLFFVLLHQCTFSSLLLMFLQWLTAQKCVLLGFGPCWQGWCSPNTNICFFDSTNIYGVGSTAGLSRLPCVVFRMSFYYWGSHSFILRGKSFRLFAQYLPSAL